MRVRYTPDPALPPLAYVGIAAGSDLHLLHGSMVETTPSFFSDGVWAGSFDAGPDEATFISGTAGVVTEDGLNIYTPDSPTDRVFAVQLSERWVFANSLPVILAALDDGLDISHTSYRSTFLAADLGVRLAPRAIPTARGRTLHIVMGGTATLTPRGITFRLRHPEVPFTGFCDYRTRLSRTLQATLANAADSSRQHPLEPQSSLSAGYDSSAVAVLAAEAGVTRALTLERRAPDGALIDHPGVVAETLGLELIGVQRDTWRTRADLPEASVAASGVKFADVPFLALEPFLAGTLLMTGWGGDRLWSPANFRAYPEVVRGIGSIDGRGLAEHRLQVGYAIVAVPTIGQTGHPSIYRITHSDEMLPWRVDSPYDRPIPRRIVEEAGVPRGAFATRKLGSQARGGARAGRYVGRTRDERMAELLESMSPAAATSFLDFLDACDLDGDDRRGRTIRAKLVVRRAATVAVKKLEVADYRAGRRLHRWGIRGVVPRRTMSALAARAKVDPGYTYLLPHWGTHTLKRPVSGLSSRLQA